MSDRELIRSRVRAATRHRASHPGAHPSPCGARDFETFSRALRGVGGEAEGPLAPGSLGAEVARKARAWVAQGRVVVEASAVPLVGSGPYEVAARDSDPHAFHDVEVAVIAASVGVAEDAAVAVLGRDAPQRSLLFLTQRLILLLDAQRIVSDLHAGFRALPNDALGPNPLTWISGPSKTADIEQTLVLGAHGPRALAVFVYQTR